MKDGHGHEGQYPGLARKDGLGTEDKLAMKRVLPIMDDELAVQDRLLSQGRHTELSAARELPALLSTHSSRGAGKGSSTALPVGI